MLRMNKNRQMLAGILCLMMVLSFASVVHADDKTTITFYCNPSKNGGVEAAVAAFEAANPGIHVEIVEFSSDTNQKKTTLSSIFQAQDDSADVFMMDCTWPDEFISAGWLLPLDGLYTEEELAAIRALARDAQFYWDFVFVENAEGAHNPKLTNYCLDQAEDLCNQAMAMFHQIVKTKP